MADQTQSGAGSMDATGFPLPGQGVAVVAVQAPGAGPGFWAGASCAVPYGDGGYLVGYRVRNGHDGTDQVVVARSPDGESFETVVVLDDAAFGADWLERPALVALPSGRWRLYVCAGTPTTKRWWIDAVEADDPAAFTADGAVRAFPDAPGYGVKDPVVRLVDGTFHAWVCCHPLDEPGEEDRMTTAYATSADGLAWDWHGTVLAGRPGRWDGRGARVTTVLADGRVAYDGRASAEENWFERTALAVPAGDGPGLVALADGPVIDVRYLDAVPLAAGGHRLWYEARLPDESHELRTELIAPPS